MKFQLLSAFINLHGSRDNVVFRGPDEPITYPEALVLQAIHGGSEHVHTLVEVGSVERQPGEEYDRLMSIYGATVAAMFPGAAGRASLPHRDDSLPTQDEVEAARAAADKALADRRKQRSGTKAGASKTGKPSEKASDADSKPVDPADPDETGGDTGLGTSVPDLVGE